MDSLPFLLLLVVVAVLFGFAAYRAWRARNGLVKWGGTVIGALVALGAAVLAVTSLIGFIQFNLPPMNPSITSKVNGSFPVGNFVLTFAESGQRASLKITNTAELQRAVVEYSECGVCGGGARDGGYSRVWHTRRFVFHQ